MKKQFAVSVATLVAIGAITVNAADANQNKTNFKDIIESVKEKGIYEEMVGKLSEKDCDIFKLFDFIKDLCPDNNFPEINIPDFNLPDQDKPETKPDIPSVPEEKPEIKPEDKPEQTPDVKPEEKPEESPETKPEQKPDNDSGTSQNSYASEILRLVNNERTSKGLKALTLDLKISSAADIRAKEIVSVFSHTRPDGRSCFTVLSDNGISYGGAGENIAYGQNSPSEVMTAWMNSEGHRANILNSSFTKLGVGTYSSGGTMYWVQLFTY